MNAKNKMLRYLLIGACLISSGCTTHAVTGVIGRNIAPPSSPPNIIYGQKALVKGYVGDKEAWQATGMFSSVEVTDSPMPPSQGVLIVNECTTKIKSNFLIDISKCALFVVSLGIIPVYWEYEARCDSEFYQNGKRLATNTIFYDESGIMGWAAHAYDANVTYRKEAQLRLNALLNNIK